MKHLLVSIFACITILLTLTAGNSAQARPLTAFSLPGLPIAETEVAQDWMKQLESEVLPQVEKILTPEQNEKLKASIAEGASFRKVFKSLALTPEQKSQLGSLLKTLPKKDAFAALTPEQKKKLFMKKKEMFMPSSEEIGAKIDAGMKKGQEKAGSFIPKGKESLIPSPADIAAKISEKLQFVKDKFQQ
jgi:hypothetical protein